MCTAHHPPRLSTTLACSFSIHCSDRQPGELNAAQKAFPLPIPGCQHMFHTGFAAEESFGATSYFIQRPQVKGRLQSSDCHHPAKRLAQPTC